MPLLRKHNLDGEDWGNLSCERDTIVDMRDGRILQSLIGGDISD